VTITLSTGCNPARVFEELTQQKVFISLRGDKLRYSPHFYNTVEEVRGAASMTLDISRKLSST
jgi:selenocysteine lyase/cysteine desulfurase